FGNGLNDNATDFYMPDKVELSPPSPSPSPPASASQRLLSLDTYRGAVMFFLAAGSVALTPALLKGIFPDSEFWKFLSTQWSHADWRSSTVTWTGFRVWDMIQPAFMFMVGVSMPFSYGKRQELGQSYWRMLGHAVYRAIFLVLLGVFLRSLRSSHTYWTFEDVVTQIGLGYVFLFLLWNRSWRTQAVCAAVILIGYWYLWKFWPNIAGLIGVERTAVAGWPRADDPGQALDVWLLNQEIFPRTDPFINHDYYTLNFVPSLVTMIFGLMAGHLLRGPQSAKRQLSMLLMTGVAGVLLGLAADRLGICPIIKKIWTPSWTLYSGGLCLIILAWFYWTIDVLGFRKWTLPFVVFGVNSVAIYILTWTWSNWLPGNLSKHLNPTLLAWAPDPWKRLIVSLLAFAILWSIFYWMYRRKIFLRI
ncbi:MAG: DUF5009 domain-containing protein, partial [Pirellulales bacterium]